MKPQGNPVAAVDVAPTRLLRIEDIATELSVSRSFAWKLLASGEIRSVRLGRAVRVRRADLDAYLADPARER